MSGSALDLLIVGAGPTGIAIGAEARRAGLETLLVDRGPLVASLVAYPAEMEFFTTRERLEIAGVPFALPEEKPNRRQAIAYYQAVADKFALPLALYEDVLAVERREHGFRVHGRGREGETVRHAGAVAVATGYFSNPIRLAVPGEQQAWVRCRYREPWEHFGEDVVVVGAGNSGAEAALDLFRHGARVTLVGRGPAVKPTVKYWLKPDLENRIAEGSIRALFEAEVLRFGAYEVVIRRRGETMPIPARAAYVLVGYRPDTRWLAAAGIRVDAATGVPEFDPGTCQSNVPGLYVAGTIQAGNETHRIFIENSRADGEKIVRHLLDARRQAGQPAGAG